MINTLILDRNSCVRIKNGETIWRCMVMTVKQMVNAAALFIAPLHSAAGVESRGADTGPGQGT